MFPNLHLPYQYAYATACVALVIFWVLIHLTRRDLHREMLLILGKGNC